MQRVMRRVIAVTIASTVLVTGLVVLSSDADAQRRRRRRQQAPQAEQTPHTDAIEGAMGAIEWGWSRRELVEHFTKQIRAEYRPQIHKARDAMTGDRIHQEMNLRIRRMRDSYIRFNGRTTGHDTGFLRDEFTHRNGESMIRVRGDNSDDYYFFIRGRLWKWYRAFDSSVFQGADFAQFSAALGGRFGEGRSRTGTLQEGARTQTWLEWQDNTTRLRALDNNQFYGFYCLVFEDKATLANLDTLRTNGPRERDTGHALVNAVTRDSDEPENLDGNADIVDRLTGNIRNRQQAPAEDEGSSTRQGRRNRDRGNSRQRTRPRTRPPSDDPLRGLD